MARVTVTIQRLHIWGTNHYYLSAFYRSTVLMPSGTTAYGISSRMELIIPDDAAGLERIKAHIKARGASHVRFIRDQWPANQTPKGGKL